MSLRTQRGGVEGPTIDPPIAPSTTLFLHVSARVCAAQEFVLAHGTDALHSFQPIRSAVPASIVVSASAPRLTAASIAAANASRVASEATVGAVHAAATGAVKERVVLTDVVSSLLAELVKDATVDEAFHTLPPGSVPLFGQLSRTDAASPAVGGAGAPTPVYLSGEEITSEHRVPVLALGEFQDLCGKLVENTVLNLAREACHGEFEVCKPPVVMVRL